MTPAAAAFSVGARAAGIVIALGYLVGLVDGPIVAVVGALGLVALGRAIALSRVQAPAAGLAFAILAGALGVAALRWGALGLTSLRGAQAVLGPTVTVGPPAVAAAAGVAGLAAAAAAGIWLSDPSPRGRAAVVLHALEIAVAAFAIATAFWGPALVPGDGERTLSWVGVSGGVVAITTLLAVAAARVGLFVRVVVAATAGVAVLGAAAAVTASV